MLSRFDADARVCTLLGLCVGRVLLKAARRGEDWAELADAKVIAHVADWLRAALNTDARWLANVDARGRPKKLLKFETVKQIGQEADKAMLKAAQRNSTVKIAEGDEEFFEALENGFYTVRLLTPAALDRESAEMQHCIGAGGYDEFLGRPNYLLLSLRDRHGKAHATLEIDDGWVQQVQGKQNEAPNPYYMEVVVPLIVRRGYSHSLSAAQIGGVIDVNGKWHPLDRFPMELHVPGTLDLTCTHLVELPEVLTVGGYLHIHRDTVRLPSKLSVGKSLRITGEVITALPEELYVGEDLNLEKSSIEKLPEGLVVGRSIMMNDQTDIYLPESIADDTAIYIGTRRMDAETYRAFRERDRNFPITADRRDARTLKPQMGF
jgi:hypothetical protein|nr:PcfJ domain-containing protein [Neorhizobium tomejilense]